VLDTEFSPLQILDPKIPTRRQMVLTHKSFWKDFDACIIIDVSDE
jgi:hypothetical protein